MKTGIFILSLILWLRMGYKSETSIQLVEPLSPTTISGDTHHLEDNLLDDLKYPHVRVSNGFIEVVFCNIWETQSVALLIPLCLREGDVLHIAKSSTNIRFHNDKDYTPLSGYITITEAQREGEDVIVLKGVFEAIMLCDSEPDTLNIPPTCFSISNSPLKP
jgi:hypothetical protein